MKVQQEILDKWQSLFLKGDALKIWQSIPKKQRPQDKNYG